MNSGDSQLHLAHPIVLLSLRKCCGRSRAEPSVPFYFFKITHCKNMNFISLHTNVRKYFYFLNQIKSHSEPCLTIWIKNPLFALASVGSQRVGLRWRRCYVGPGNGGMASYLQTLWSSMRVPPSRSVLVHVRTEGPAPFMPDSGNRIDLILVQLEHLPSSKENNPSLFFKSFCLFTLQHDFKPLQGKLGTPFSICLYLLHNILHKRADFMSSSPLTSSLCLVFCFFMVNPTTLAFNKEAERAPCLLTCIYLTNKAPWVH